MKNINQGNVTNDKEFIYLDEEKMYSLSSQIFEGITEYVLSESASSNNESESQKDL